MYLNVHSYYSLRYGTLSPDELLCLAKEKGHEVLPLTDINNSSGVLEFVKIAKEKGVKALAGMEFRVDDQLLYIGIARNAEGFRELNELLSDQNLYNAPLPARPKTRHCYMIYPYGHDPLHLMEHEYIGVQPKDIVKVLLEKNSFKKKYVALPAITFSTGFGFELHRQLRAIDKNILLGQLTKEQQAPADDGFMTVAAFKKCYESLPELLENNRRILDDCTFDFDFQKVKNKQVFTTSKYDDKLLLEKLALDGMKQRYGLKNKEAIRRVKSELEVIDKLGFSAYFLITWDIIRYSMSCGFYHVGRGSGANSVVAYCLKITDVCPIELDLYFERFLNPKRKSPPDFDIDYCWTERDAVQEYIFKRYGSKHTALLGALSTFKDKSIVRELGKVHGLPKGEIDRLVLTSDHLLNQHGISATIQHFKNFLANFPNIRSIHAGGVLISEEPIACYTALDLPPKGFPTTQFDMYLAEDIRFDKLDILSQRGLGHIKECVELVQENKGIKVEVHAVSEFKKDEKVRNQLRASNTIGCFYIESPGMRGLLSKLQCSDYLTLVAASSIIRPGVASSGMMKEYIQRFHHPHDFKYLHPVMEEQLKETYGVMIYQEDVLKVCHHFGGLDLSDADVLRRMMSGKGKNNQRLEEIVAKFFSNCRSYGYKEEITQEVWRQIASFAGYSFSKAHSASYAVESYQSLYLKTHFPMEFMVAVINNFGGFYATWVYVHEAKKTGADLRLPCINNSQSKTAINQSVIYLGLALLKGLDAGLVQTIVKERSQGGLYNNLENFISRTRIGLEHLLALIKAGALRTFDANKKTLLWEAHFIFNAGKNNHPGNLLFAVKKKEYHLPVFEISKLEDAYDELELLGFTVSLSAFDLLATPFRGQLPARGLKEHIGKNVKMLGHFVTAKYIRTKHGAIMSFATWLDADGDFFDTTHFPDILKAMPFKGDGTYLILGKIVQEFEFPSIEVIKMAKLPILPDPRMSKN